MRYSLGKVGCILRSVALLTAMGTGLAMATSARAEGPTDVVTQHNDVQRSGTTFGETALSPATVNSGSFGKLASFPIDGPIYAQPLYLHGVDIPDAGLRDVVYIATVLNTLYAFDADSLDSTPLFQTSFGYPVPGTVTKCADLSPDVGITATPTIDVNTGVIYLECRTEDAADGGAQHHTLHAVDVRNGQDVLTPVEITASVPVAGQPDVVFDPAMQNSRPGLLLANGNVYLAYASLCDFTPYHGWLFSYSASTLQQQDVFLTTPNGTEGGIWMGGGGLVSDSQGNVYASVGNGTMDLMSDGGTDLSMSMARWTPDLQLADWFSPADQAAASLKDLDLGPSPTLLIEDQGLLVGGGKQGIIWVANSNDLGHQQPNDTQVQQIVTPMPTTTPQGWSGMASFPDPGGPKLFLWGYSMPLTAYQYSDGALIQVDMGTLTSPPHKSGCPMSISVNEPDAGPGIVWTLGARVNNAYHTMSPGTLRAFSTDDLGTELWDSDMHPVRDALGYVARFTPPTIADGKVFAPTFSNQIEVYGLLPDDGGTEDAGDGDTDGGTDGGETEDAGDGGGMEDAGDGGTDGGEIDDAGDGGNAADGGADSGIHMEEAGDAGGHPTTPSGCGCTTSTAGWWWVSLPLAAGWSRRRRRG